MKKFLLVMLVIGGLIMIGLSSCASSEVKKGSREDIEQQLDEMKKVYPTKNVEDLFEIFPDGFEIEQTYIKNEFTDDAEYTKLVLIGNSENRSISGKLSRGEEIIDVTMQKGTLLTNNKQKISDIWPYKGFIFKFYEINKETLNQLDMESKRYIGENGGYEISYNSGNQSVKNFLNISLDRNFQLHLTGSKGEKNYRHAVVIRWKRNSFSEIVKQLKKGGEYE